MCKMKVFTYNKQNNWFQLVFIDNIVYPPVKKIVLILIRIHLSLELKKLEAYVDACKAQKSNYAGFLCIKSKV